MTDLEVRRPKFDFTDDVPWEWNPHESRLLVLHERHVDHRDRFRADDRSGRAGGQTADHRSRGRSRGDRVPAPGGPALQHASQACHRADQALPGLAADVRRTRWPVSTTLTATKPLEFRLAYVADFEATFTPSFKMMLDNEETLFRPGDDRVASLFMWHFVEEVEHRSSALVIYRRGGGSEPWYRLRVLPAVVKHLLEHVMALIADGVNAHVPGADRKVDARMLSAHAFEEIGTAEIAVRTRSATARTTLPRSLVPRTREASPAGAHESC